MGRVLAFRHVPFEGLGRIEPVLRARGYEIDYADLYLSGAPLPQTDAYQALIFLGGPMSVNDPLPYLRREEEFIRAAIHRGTPVLGVCLGSQLIASALGAAVRRNPVPEIGWFELEFTPAARHDPVFGGLTAPETVFHWHGETFDLPPGAELLASSQLCRNQAFRLGATVYGLQFHLEATPAMIADWCLQDENCADVRELDRPIDPGTNAERLAQLAGETFGKWCDSIHTRTPGAEDRGLPGA
jgi:GMP synthase-like glutamine amidotransferase